MVHPSFESLSVADALRPTRVDRNAGRDIAALPPTPPTTTTTTTTTTILRGGQQQQQHHHHQQQPQHCYETNTANGPAMERTNANTRTHNKNSFQWQDGQGLVSRRQQHLQKPATRTNHPMDDSPSPILWIVVMAANTLCLVMCITNLLLWYFYYSDAMPIGESGGGSILRLQNDEIALLVLGVGTTGMTVMVAGMGLWGTFQHNKTMIRVAAWVYTVVTVGSAMAHAFKVMEVVGSSTSDNTTTGILRLLWNQRQEWITVLGAACLAYTHHVLLRQYSRLDDHGPKKKTW
jgi:hypothetical protein